MFIKNIMELTFFIQISVTLESTYMDNSNDYKQKYSEVEVRAVFINCEPDLDWRGVPSDSEEMRFEREELFKHNVLHSCHKKLALTLKLTSGSNLNPADEYIPVEHIFEGKRRVRLLNPYVLRLHREAPLQAYKLRRIDIVKGKLTTDDIKIQENYGKKKRTQRAIKNSENDLSVQFTLGHDQSGQGNHSTKLENHRSLATSATFVIEETKGSKNYVKKEVCASNGTSRKRNKRHERNLIVEEKTNENKASWISKDPFYKNIDERVFKENSQEIPLNYGKSIIDNEFPMALETQSYLHHPTKSYYKKSAVKNNRKKSYEHEKIDSNKEINFVPNRERLFYEFGNTTFGNSGDLYRGFTYNDQSKQANNFDIIEKDFELFEIGAPNLWYTIQVQMFEKLNTPEGKTVWNDLTKGKPVSISAINSEWISQDISVKYRPVEWLRSDDFTLPKTSLCLLVPIYDTDALDENTSFQNDFNEEFIIVPMKDVVGLDKGSANNIKKRYDVSYDSSNVSTNPSTEDGQGHRRVLVRVTKALFGYINNGMSIVSRGSDLHLTIPLQRPHHSQIDLEIRADDNQLVRVGSSGRITTIVADSTRKARTVLTLQVMNTGLAAARFRVVARDCGPALSNTVSDKDSSTGYVLLPPRHTRQLRLELPIDFPVEIVHCTATMVNSDDKSVAVRDVSIKKEDRCFCVWHCECICLSEDPKLLCQEMSQSKQAAAGLSTRERPRRIRSVCYHDNSTMNILITTVGVLMALLFLGFLKALTGLVFRCIGSYGLDRLLQTPRNLDQYYESSLRDRQVEYDDKGWPVHPDTKFRTVRVISRSMEFILNLIFFVTVPCIILWDVLKKLACRNASTKAKFKSQNVDTKKCYSSQDLQDLEPQLRRRRGGLRRWMTPHAEELSTIVWKKGLNPIGCDLQMRPLLHEQVRRTDGAKSDEITSSCVDSEQDDTEYVLMQMQKSRESLTKTQKKACDTTKQLPQKNIYKTEPNNH